jgi:hypothetical protein
MKKESAFSLTFSGRFRGDLVVSGCVSNIEYAKNISREYGRMQLLILLSVSNKPNCNQLSILHLLLICLESSQLLRKTEVSVGNLAFSTIVNRRCCGSEPSYKTENMENTDSKNSKKLHCVSQPHGNVAPPCNFRKNGFGSIVRIFLTPHLVKVSLHYERCL